MTDLHRQQEKEERRKEQEHAQQNEVETMRVLAFEAGRKLAEIPREAKGNEPLLENYKKGIEESRKELEKTQDANQLTSANRLEREVERAIIEAQQVREAVGREKALANDFHRHAEPGETYRGRVIGRTNSFVIQADDSRHGEIILHERAAVSGAEKVQMNDHAEISYPHGRAGIVRNKQGAQHQHQRQMEKGGAGREHGR